MHGEGEPSAAAADYDAVLVRRTCHAAHAAQHSARYSWWSAVPSHFAD